MILIEKIQIILMNISKLLSNPLASYYLINLDVLTWQTADFDERIILPLFIFSISGFLLSVFFLHFKQYDSIAL